MDAIGKYNPNNDTITITRHALEEWVKEYTKRKDYFDNKDPLKPQSAAWGYCLGKLDFCADLLNLFK